MAHGIVPFVPLLPLVGVLLRVLVRSAGGGDDPPSVLDAPVDLLRRSVGAALVALVYVGPPLAFLVGMVEVVSGSGGVEGGSFPVLAAATVGGIAMLVATYLLPVALASYVASGSLRAAFDRTRLRRGARSGSYLLGWLVAVVALDAGLLLAGWLGGATVRGVLGALVVAYSLVVAARLVGAGLSSSGLVDGGGPSTSRR
nr:DUF4013 domain-containing protein [Halomarina salina]